VKVVAAITGAALIVSIVALIVGVTSVTQTCRAGAGDTFAFADLVVSAGGTMNREAAALGVPVYTTYGGRLGGVDEQLIRDGRLRPLTDPRALELEKRGREAGGRERRDPQLMLDLLLSARDGR